MRASEITSKITSRKDLYSFLQTHSKATHSKVQILLPKQSHCTVRFMKHIIQGKRLVRFELPSTFLTQTPIAVQQRTIPRLPSRTYTNAFATSTRTLDVTFLTMTLTMCHRGSSSGLYSSVCSNERLRSSLKRLVYERQGRQTRKDR